MLQIFIENMSIIEKILLTISVVMSFNININIKL